MLSLHATISFDKCQLCIVYGLSINQEVNIKKTTQAGNTDMQRVSLVLATFTCNTTM